MPSDSGETQLQPLTAHPQQLGLREFAAYALVVDARSEARFQEDHIPGAVSVPLAARGGRAPSQSDLGALLSPLPRGSAVLLYAQSGERTMGRWADWLRSQGFTVDVLSGGWRNYRRWVEAGLELLPRMFEFRVVLVPLGVDAAPVLKTLQDSAEQVLDLGSGGRFGSSSSAAAVDSWLLDALRHRETDRPLWVFDRADRQRSRLMPAAMRDAMGRAQHATLAADVADPRAMAREVKRLMEDFDRQSKP